MQSLHAHLEALPAGALLSITGSADVVITAPFEENAALVKPGGVFVARAGRSADGHAYIPQAIASGAAAIIGEQDLRDLPVPYVRVADGMAALGYLAASFHRFPSRDLVVIGVTGTDGKTTTSTLIYELLKDHTEGRIGLISTISADFGGQSLPTGLHVTTPSAPEVQHYLAMMRDAGLTHVVLEMTSHGLAQGRLNGVDIDVAVYTNITHEHLDYHGTWEAYREAKALLFRGLMRSARKPNQPKISVVNVDDPSCEYLAAIPTDRVVRYGIEHPADVRAAQIAYSPRGTTITLTTGEVLESHLYGQFNVSNVLAAVAAARALGAADVQSGLARVRGVSGRMESIDEGQPFLAMVDFAHTPNALKQVLTAARGMLGTGGRLIAVFGSAGLRDVEKRRMMAETSAQLADITILTAEDPRTESLDDILEMMAQGCIRFGGVEGQTFFRVPDRGAALHAACQMARAGDMVIACGKGHEQSMCFGTIEYPWDDREALRAALRGAPLKTLPTATT
ncbi:MAG: UDP-N-acetylmuramoyl-L-alanyl-D-glutamate--2,6-diaminopimelate ligase [Anaerolineae bacterium]